VRLGIVADIHGNDVALRAVLGDAKRIEVDRWWALGDLVLLGPRPAEVLALEQHACDWTGGWSGCGSLAAAGFCGSMRLRCMVGHRGSRLRSSRASAGARVRPALSRPESFFMIMADAAGLAGAWCR
jgi:hypothetical protein